MHKYLDYAPPADFVVYEEHAAEAAQLLAGGGGYKTLDWNGLPPAYLRAWQPPACFQPVRDPPFEAEPHLQTLVFAHGLTSPAGLRRLVFVEMAIRASTQRDDDGYVIDLHRNLYCRSFEVAPEGPKTLWFRGTFASIDPTRGSQIVLHAANGTVTADRADGTDVRIFAGQPDPLDPSHFTIQYQIGSGNRKTINANLGDDGQINVRLPEIPWQNLH
jgi:hypothetical protein